MLARSTNLPGDVQTLPAVKLRRDASEVDISQSPYMQQQVVVSRGQSRQSSQKNRRSLN